MPEETSRQEAPPRTFDERGLDDQTIGLLTVARSTGLAQLVVSDRTPSNEYGIEWLGVEMLSDTRKPPSDPAGLDTAT